MLAYYFFVQRKVIERIQIGVRWHEELTEPMGAFLDTYYVVEHVFGCCFAALLLLMLLMLLMLLGHYEYLRLAYCKR